MLLQRDFAIIDKLQDSHNNIYYNIELILLSIENNKKTDCKFSTILNNKNFKKQKLTIF